MVIFKRNENILLSKNNEYFIIVRKSHNFYYKYEVPNTKKKKNPIRPPKEDINSIAAKAYKYIQKTIFIVIPMTCRSP